jgi:predicted CoA-binding protein
MARNSQNIIELLSDPSTTVAVVGATDSRQKFGSTIYRDLKGKGFRVYPVNRRRSTVDGDQAYPDLASLPTPPTIVNIVVPPEQTLSVLEDARALGVSNIWIQPGAADDAVRDYVSRHRLNAVIDACIMVQARPLVAG